MSYKQKMMIQNTRDIYARSVDQDIYKRVYIVFDCSSHEAFSNHFIPVIVWS